MSTHQALVGMFGDSPALASAAYYTWGWKGGLDVLAPSLAGHSRFKESIRSTWDTPKLKQILDSELIMYTPDGRRLVSLSDGERSFGGLIDTQLIGLTICAIAHELGGEAAAYIFLKYFVEYICNIQSTDIDDDAFRLFISDERRVKLIINEGQTMGLNKRFLAACNRLNMPAGDVLKLAANSYTENPAVEYTEAHMVVGLLRWLGGSTETCYYTRSALVARTAAYLREIGWPIHDIISWDGKESGPGQTEHRSVVLVLGGDHDADKLELSRQEHIPQARVHHYRIESIGQMLSASYRTMAYFCDPNLCQVFFDVVYQGLIDKLFFRFAPGKTILEIKIVFEPVDLDSDGASDLASELAKIYFPRSAKHFESCYEALAYTLPKISNDIIDIDELSQHLDSIIGSELSPNRTLIYFRAYTAGIVFAFFGALDKDGFKNKDHSTALDSTSEDWLQKMCKVVDDGVADGLGYWEAVWALAMIHCAADPENECHRDTIAWRNGAYGVLPRIMLRMSLDLKALDICLIDDMWANVYPDENGSIHTGWTSLSFTNPKIDDLIDNLDEECLENHGIEFTEANFDKEPVTDFQFSFERPLHYMKSHLSLVAQSYGKAMGSTGIRDILVGILSSDSHRNITACSGHENQQMVVVLSPSLWIEEERTKPFSQTRVNLIPVGKQVTLAAYLLGRNMWYKPKLVTGCPQCSFTHIFQENDEHKIAIGYRMESGQLDEEASPLSIDEETPSHNTDEETSPRDSGEESAKQRPNKRLKTET